MNLLIRNSLIPIDEKVVEELEQISKLQIKNGNGEVARLIGADGEEITLHAPLIEVLKEIARLTQEQIIPQVGAFNGKLTVPQAANILRVREKYFNQLLETGELAYQNTETGRYVDYNELLSYKKKRDAIRRENLDRVVEISQELGLYD